jgi:hypothetical protein
MKKSKNIVLIVTPVISAALFNACGGSSSQPYPLANATATTATPYPLSTAAPETTQTRDVYNNLDDCVKDWVDKELCEQMSEDDDKDYKKRYKTGGKNRYFFGPSYSSNNRIITYKGKTITPTGKVATKMPSFVSSVPSSKTTTGTTTTKSGAVPSSSSTSKPTTSTTSSTTSSSSSTSTYSPYSSSSTTRGGFGSTSSSYSSSSRSSSSGS